LARAGEVRAAGQLLVDHFQTRRADANEGFSGASCRFGEVLESWRLAKFVQYRGLHSSSLFAVRRLVTFKKDFTC
jgi:hypothetical protein